MEEATSMDTCEITALQDRDTAEEADVDDPAEVGAEGAAVDDPAEVSGEVADVDDPAEVSAEEAAGDDPAEVSVSAEEAAGMEGEERQPGDIWGAEDVGAEYGDDATSVPDSGMDLFESEQAPATKPATKLPISKIKKIMKFDPDVTMANQDAVFLVAKATVSSESFNALASLWTFLYVGMQLDKKYPKAVASKSVWPNSFSFMGKDVGRKVVF